MAKGRYFVFVRADGTETQANFDVVDGKETNVSFQRRRRGQAPEEVEATPDLAAAAGVEMGRLIRDSQSPPAPNRMKGAYGAEKEV